MLNMTDSQKINLENMVRFVSNNGSRVRFDRYMQEHLYGENGYYRIKVEIGPGGDFGTEAMSPEFPHLIFLNLQQQSLAGKDFLELGGGTGAFKRNYLAYSPETNYISVDISKKLASMQAQGGGRVIIGDAAALNLKSDSIDGVIFSNELIDVLPCRVFKLARDNGRIKINEEGYVTIDGKALRFEFRGAERDEFLITYEEFLSQGIYPVQDGDIISVASKTADVIKEALRVLRSGKIMFVDYGFGEPISHQRRTKELPHIMRKPDYDDLGDISKILANPYSMDITYSVDFEFLKWIAKQVDPNAKVGYKDQVTLLSVFPEYHNHQQIRRPYDHFDRPSHFLVLSIDK